MGRVGGKEPCPGDIARTESEIVRIRSLAITELRTEWSAMFRRGPPPKALTKDLLARMICFRIQEDAYGGFDRATLKVLNAFADKAPVDTRDFQRFKPGTELYREYNAERHVVVVMEDGYAWQGKTYTSLSIIAKAITGTHWNGPRFFGLRRTSKGKLTRNIRELGGCGTDPSLHAGM